ncbi:hypothetical protein OCGS_0587 [Oceaniovalibus guishaninsula JLT2003]|uniref:Uncharacterized protein n=1 Tax=Oceaniovalibus guishaninsula JLT2003 TaxID=1231392 RepID=K2HGB1_9RHOB|nr:hypothetical protein [Oceaniovalibus guishaninsula]EKE45497.1 hypothetical protein OCGS_0587 [Oceaniovalibus guishaninsula JLT2003]
MSAPKTDLDKQEKRHKTPLIGMGTMVLAALLLLLGLIAVLFFRGNDPADNSVPVQIEGAPVQAPAATD